MELRFVPAARVAEALAPVHRLALGFKSGDASFRRGAQLPVADERVPGSSYTGRFKGRKPENGGMKAK